MLTRYVQCGWVRDGTDLAPIALREGEDEVVHATVVTVYRRTLGEYLHNLAYLLREGAITHVQVPGKYVRVKLVAQPTWLVNADPNDWMCLRDIRLRDRRAFETLERELTRTKRARDQRAHAARSKSSAPTDTTNSDTLTLPVLVKHTRHGAVQIRIK